MYDVDFLLIQIYYHPFTPKTPLVYALLHSSSLLFTVYYYAPLFIIHKFRYKWFVLNS